MKKIDNCPKCGAKLTDEMINVNMCWECGEFLDKSLLDDDEIKKYDEQAREIDPFYGYDIKNHKVTTGLNFEGYKIVDYKGIVSGDLVMGTSYLGDIKAKFADAMGSASLSYSDTMEKAKEDALSYLIVNSIDLGGNAVIGISFSIVSLNQNMIGVSANGTSVKIKESMPFS